MKTVVVTGGSSGIGRAVVQLFAEHGYNVGFSFNKGKAVAQQLCDSYNNVKAIKTDVTVSEQVSALVQLTAETFGGVDAVVACAGITSQLQLQDITDTALCEVLDVNFKGTFYLFRAAVPYLLQNKNGRMVAISSYFAERDGACECHYAASKAAVNGLVSALASEFAPSGITVNAISPGIVDTPMIQGHDRQSLVDATPCRRLCTPQEVAETVLFLCDASSSFITGQVIRQTGGIF